MHDIIPIFTSKEQEKVYFNELSKLPPITQMIDKSTGFYDESMCKAFDFFMEFCIKPIMPNLEKEWEAKSLKK